MEAVITRKKNKSRRKMTSPMVERPRKRWGVMASTKETPLVESLLMMFVRWNFIESQEWMKLT